MDFVEQFAGSWRTPGGFACEPCNLRPARDQPVAGKHLEPVAELRRQIGCGGLASDVENANEMADFPYLEAEDIVAALEFAAAQADHAVLRIA